MPKSIIPQNEIRDKPSIGGDELTVSGSTGAGEATAHLHLPGAYDYEGGHGEIRDAWGAFLEELGDEVSGWDWFVTMSFRDPDELKRARSPTWTKPGWKYAQTALTRFTKSLGKGKPPEEKPYWVAMMEIQKWRGVPHWHMLIGNCSGDRRMDWVDWCFQRYGITRILPYDRNLGARFYLSKYLTKQMSDLRFSSRLRAEYRCR